MKYAPGLIAAISSRPIMPCVADVSGTCNVTTSLCASSSRKLAVGSVLP
jgi:hypothetical protein